VITPHFVRPIAPGEAAKLPDFPETFLPTVPQENALRDLHKKGKGTGEPGKPEFVGPSGYQEPK
jgi:hypothetical protein